MSRPALLPFATIHAGARRRAALRRATTNGLQVEFRSADGETIESPELDRIVRLAAEQLAAGHDVVVLSSDAELTPTEAGRMLGVSRQYVDRLIDLDELPARRLEASTHRRIRVADLVEFQQRRANNKKRISDAVNTIVDAGAKY